MKTTKLLLAAAAFTGLVSLSFAGPGPDYWARMTEAAKNRAAIAKTQPAAQVQVAAACATCSCCKDMKKS